MTYSSHAATLRKNAVICVSNLTHHDAVMAKLMRAGVLPVLTKLLGTSVESSIHNGALGAIANLAVYDSVKLKLVESPALAHIVRLLDSNFEENQYRALTALGNLAAADKDSISKCIADAGAISKLVKLLGSASGNTQERASIGQSLPQPVLRSEGGESWCTVWLEGGLHDAKWPQRSQGMCNEGHSEDQCCITGLSS